MPSKRPASPFPFAEGKPPPIPKPPWARADTGPSTDTYFSSDLPYMQTDASASYLRDSERMLQRQKSQRFGPSMPSPPCSRTMSFDSAAHSNGSSMDNIAGSTDSHLYYCSPMTNGATDLPAMYDFAAGQYQYPQARGYFNQASFNQSSYTLPTTPLEQPSFPQVSMPQYDLSYMAQTPSTTNSGRQNMWDSRWNTLFDPPKAHDSQNASPSTSHYQQPSQPDLGNLAADFESSRRQSTDTGSSSVTSARSGNNPVSTVLAHHVYTILQGEQAWNMIKQLQRAEILRDVWSEIATLTHPDKAIPEAQKSPLWEKIVSGKYPLNLHELNQEDFVLATSGLAVLARCAAQLQPDGAAAGNALGTSSPLRVFVDSHLGQ